MKVFSLKCANCGGALDVRDDMDTFACGYCGASQVVERSGGVVSLRKLERTLEDVKSSSSRTASELALSRLANEMASARARHEQIISLLRAGDEDTNRKIGTFIAIGIGVAIVLFYVLGWWATPVVIAGVVFGFRAVPTNSDKIKAAERAMEIELTTLQQQIEEHRAIANVPVGSKGSTFKA